MEKEEKKLKVIGLIMEDIFTEFAKEVIRGVENAAKEMKDIRLIVLVGRQNEQTEDEDKHFRYKTVYNYIYRLEETSKFDGLILTLPNLLAIEKDSYGLDKIRNFDTSWKRKKPLINIWSLISKKPLKPSIWRELMISRSY